MNPREISEFYRDAIRMVMQSPEEQRTLCSHLRPYADGTVPPSFICIHHADQGYLCSADWEAHHITDHVGTGCDGCGDPITFDAMPISMPIVPGIIGQMTNARAYLVGLSLCRRCQPEEEQSA